VNIVNNLTTQKQKTYYITTPIYYPSGNWHIGHCYTTVNCDALARYKRHKGYQVVFGTGTDEHGQKVADVAASKGLDPQTHLDERATNIKQLWKLLDVNYDIFVRTTDDYHCKSVQDIFARLYQQGDIYKSKYEGKYCVPCESFWTESQLSEGCCPDCKRIVIDSSEDCYFFALSKYSDKLLDLLTNTDFLQPRTRVNEMVNFIREGLQDLAVTRSNVKWGIPVPWDTKHTLYVWVDALSNYITMLGYGSSDQSRFEQFWPADLQVVGKEIVRFHTIIWPGLLMALGLPLPRKVYGHGWLLLDGDKMSKSKGNTADPFELVDKYGLDAFRYYLLREVPFGADGTYSLELFLTRYNNDLVNIYGNLVSRTFAMARQNFGGVVNSQDIQVDKVDNTLIQLINDIPSTVDQYVDTLNISKALESIINLCIVANKYIDDTRPWILAKQDNAKLRLKAVLYNLLQSIRVATEQLVPFLTDKPQRVLQALNYTQDTYNLQELSILYARVDILRECKQALQ
jgi:methionyl-tRNA synthetase